MILKFFKGCWIYLLVALFSFACGWYSCVHFGANVVEKQVEVPVEIPVKIPVEVKGDTEVVYVEKDSPNDADVQINSEKPVVQLEYNGEVHQFETLDNETQKFEKGKLKVESSTKTTLDVTPIVDREVKIAEEAKDSEFKEEKKQIVEDFNKKIDKEKGKSHRSGFWAGVGTTVGTAGLLMLAL